MSTSEGSLNFSVDSALLFELGEQLVARPSIALAELVKNAYDADATQVRIIFDGVGTSGGGIIIEDNGHGMTIEEIQNGWMRIASSNKQANATSRKYKRSLTGAKGIGRFATRRLGTKLQLQSTVQLSSGDKELIRVNFDWAEFKAGSEVTDIKIDFKRTPIPSETSTGVTLYIFDTHDVWDEDELLDLKQDLTGLVSPFPPFLPIDQVDDVDPGFNIFLEAEGKEVDSEQASNLGQGFLDAAWGLLSGSIDAAGNAVYEMEFFRTKHEDSTMPDDSESYSLLSGVSFKIYYHSYDKENYNGLTISLREAQRIGREHGGVRIFMDKFRVFPYGEISDDWLRLSEIRSRNADLAASVPMSLSISEYGKGLDRPYLVIPGNNNLFGYLNLSQAQLANPSKPINQRLNIKASREGFVENEVFEQLRRFVQRGIYWLTMQYAANKAAPSVAKPKAPKAAERIAESRKSLDTLPKQIAEIAASVTEEVKQPSLWRDEAAIQRDHDQTVQRIVEALTPVVEPIRENLKAAEQDHVAEQKELISMITMLRLLASAGSSLLVMHHQFNPVLSNIAGIKFDVKKLRGSISNEGLARYERIIRQIEEWEQLVETLIAPLASLLNPEYLEKRRQWMVYEIVEEIHRATHHYMQEHEIEFINNIPRGLQTPPMYRAELYSVLLNLMTNALKAVYGQSERQIKVEASKSQENLLILHMLNTGKKALKDKWEDYFRPFISDSISDSGLGVGTGLGLSIVRDTLSEYSGTAQFIDVEGPWQTGLEIRIPLGRR